MKKIGIKYLSIYVIMGVCFVLLSALQVSAQEFRYRVQQDRLIGHRDGELIISEDHVKFRAKKEDESRIWTYGEIKLFEILSPTRVRVWTYQNRKLMVQEASLSFKIIEGRIDQQLSDFLRKRISRPLVTSLTKDETGSEPLAELPVKHLHRLGGCQGVLRVYGDRLIYEAAEGHDSRSWRWTDIRAVGRPDVDRLEVLTFEPQLAGPKRSFNFILKERLADKTYDFIWSRVFRPTPLINAGSR
jgi:hypothetical protein